MCGRYFRVAFRNRAGDQGYSRVDLLGLLIGLALCLFLILFVRQVLSLADWQPDAATYRFQMARAEPGSHSVALQMTGARPGRTAQV